MRSMLAALRDRFDGRLHPRRRDAAEARLLGLRPTSVIFVCLGNICRSPYAERLMSERARAALDVHSAGFIGPGRPPPDTALRVAKARGIDHADHRSKALSPDALAQIDVVFVFDRPNHTRVRKTAGARLDRVFWLGDFDPIWSGKRAIADPWGKSEEEFVATFERIERCVAAVTTLLEKPGRADDAR